MSQRSKVDLINFNLYEKRFVVDTNVLIDDPDSLFKFGENNLVILTSYVVDELDNFKKEMSLRGNSSRRLIKLIDRLMNNEDLAQHVTFHCCLNNPNEFRDYEFHGVLIKMTGNNHLLITGRMGDPGQVADTLLINFCKWHDFRMTLVTRDVALRVMASASGVFCEDYRNAQVASSDLYSGHEEAVMSDLNQDDLLVQSVWGMGERVNVFDESLRDWSEAKGVEVGGYFTLLIPPWYSSTLIVRRVSFDKFTIIKPSNINAFGIKARNSEQAMVMDAILDPNISLITISGLAGSGKTLMAAACALELIANQNKFSRMIITRPVVSVGKDLGFLPGNLGEKLDPWMAPFKDALDVILNKGKRQNSINKKDPSVTQIEILKMFNWIEVQSISHIRGRSIQDAILFIDEAQNATQHEIKTIISRAGENTKVILCGDPWQIDSPHMDAYSNGLAHVINKTKNYKGDEFDPSSFAHINLRAGERSPLSAFAAKIL